MLCAYVQCVCKNCLQLAYVVVIVVVVVLVSFVVFFLFVYSTYSIHVSLYVYCDYLADVVKIDT